MKKVLLAGVLAFSVMSVTMAQRSTPKIVIITLDGLRWQELYSGADPLLVSNTEYVRDTAHLKSLFWNDDLKKRRESLMPFLWKEVAEMGQLHGNRTLGSKVDLTNKMWFSYPGYNEILTGRADDARITSNDKINNPNQTILEQVNQLPQFHGKVAAFGSWDVFPYIINAERSQIPVNAGFDTAKGPGLTEREEFLNKLQPQVPSPWGTVRLDAFTHHYALEYMKREHPELLYISYGETDDFAHDGDYQAYLTSAHNTDALIRDLWKFTQDDAFYRDNTIFMVTTDHGRGTEPLETWRHHGDQVKGAGQVWLLAFGKGVAAMGEVGKEEQLFSNQIAPTLLKILGLPIDAGKMPGKPLLLDTKQ